MTDESTADSSQGRIQLERIYLKDVSFESPQAPTIFTDPDNWQPKMNLHLETEAKGVDDERYEVALTVTVTATDTETTVFLVELKQAGLFRISGFDDKTRNHVLGTACPNMLFPFARENLDHLVQKGGMPQLLLQPINFEALQAQQAARQANPSTGTGDGAAAETSPGNGAADDR
ncbi:MAG: protein-export chaperone SecB [Halofilum sp. (in: g-proteobacteria)]|nr:protein-export chaperone SecB [Halofilum sp. (in: g-proteobacteria)]